MSVHRFVFACLKLIANVGIFEVLWFEGKYGGKVVWWVGDSGVELVDHEAKADPPPAAKNDKFGVVLGGAHEPMKRA